MTGYTKLFSSITDSTIWRQPDKTRLVWITMLAMADANGIVSASVPGLADRARVPLEDCLEALRAFMSEDEWSRSKEYGGRRIEEVDGGWVLLNHAKYRAVQDAANRKEQARLGMKRLRAERAAVNTVNVGERRFTQAEAEADAEPKEIAPTVLVERKALDPNAYRVPDCPYETILDAYHDALPMLPRVVVFNGPRRASMRSRWAEVCAAEKFDEGAGLQWFCDFFHGVKKSKFLTGNTNPGKDRRAFKADLEWLMKPGNFAKVVEGRYHGELQ